MSGGSLAADASAYYYCPDGGYYAYCPPTTEPPNEPPTVVVVGGRCLHDTKAKGEIDLRVDDAESDPATLTVTATSNNQFLVPNSNIIVSGTGENRTVNVTGVAGRSGTAVITVTVSDGEDSTTLDVTVKIGTTANNLITGTTGPDMLFGLPGNDTLNGDAGNDLLCGARGNDNLNGGDGNDVLDGEGGNDNLNGGNGDDRLLGGADRDNLTGGPGADFFSGGFGIDMNIDFNPGEGDTSDGT